MKRILTIIVAYSLFALMNSSCSPNYHVTKVVRPKKHVFHYNPKWHKKVKRTHIVKLKH